MSPRLALLYLEVYGVSESQNTSKMASSTTDQTDKGAASQESISSKEEAGMSVSPAQFIKKNAKKQFRKRRRSEEESDGVEIFGDLQSTLDQAKEIQKLRSRPAGVSVETLARGKVSTKKVVKDDSDPFKLNTGGILDMKNVKTPALSNESEDDIVNLRATFSTETGRRDEDVEMVKYVETKMAEVRGTGSSQEDDKNKLGASSEDVWLQVPEKYRASLSKKTEETMSNQMLSGIPEVDLGIEAKISNIEATETAKARIMIQRKTASKNQASEFVPVNMAVNFVQHSRWKDSSVEDPAAAARRKLKKEQEEAVITVPVVGGTEIQVLKDSKSKSKTTATDDFHYERFKKQVLRR